MCIVGLREKSVWTKIDMEKYTQKILNVGGEGVVLWKRYDSSYEGGRSQNVVKYKVFNYFSVLKKTKNWKN